MASVRISWYASLVVESRGQRAHVYSRTKGDEAEEYNAEHYARCGSELLEPRRRVFSSSPISLPPRLSFSPPASTSSARSARVRDRKKMQLINDQKIGPAGRFLPRTREKVRTVQLEELKRVPRAFVSPLTIS